MYLDPCHKHCNSNCTVELRLPVWQKFKVRERVWFFQKLLQFVTHCNRSEDVETDADNRDDNHKNVQNIPEALKVAQPVFFNLMDGWKWKYISYRTHLYQYQPPMITERTSFEYFTKLPASTNLNGFFHHIVYNKESKQSFTREDKVISCWYVADQFHCSESPGGNDTSCSRQFHHKAKTIEHELSRQN